MIRKTMLGMILGATTAIASAASTVNLNEASAEKLAQALDGIGDVRAQSIVDYRKANGDFSSVNALVKVDGIGEVTLKKNRERLSVGAE